MDSSEIPHNHDWILGCRPRCVGSHGVVGRGVGSSHGREHHVGQPGATHAQHRVARVGQLCERRHAELVDAELGVAGEAHLEVPEAAGAVVGGEVHEVVVREALED